MALGVWVRWGSAHEPREFEGIAHLLEHMVFKGTERRSAHQIAAEIEGLGGSLDGYTSREHTLYQARVLGEHLGVAVEVLADLVFHPRLRSEDLDLERRVILDEIAGVEDTPDDWIFDLHAQALWGEHPYGSPILGTRETLGTIGRKDLVRVWERVYRPSRCVVSAAGQVDHDELVGVVERAFPRDDEPSPADADGPPPRPRSGGVENVERDTAQVHLCLGAQTFPHADARRHALEVASVALGGGMSSRLFQRVREELGLAYSVYAYHALYRGAGQVGVYAGTHPSAAERTLGEIVAELRRMGREPLSTRELEAVKNQVNGQRMLALESTTARMICLALFPLYGEPYETIAEGLARTEAVGADELRTVCEEFLAPERLTVLTLGPSGKSHPVFNVLPA